MCGDSTCTVKGGSALKASDLTKGRQFIASTAEACDKAVKALQTGGPEEASGNRERIEQKEAETMGRRTTIVLKPGTLEKTPEEFVAGLNQTLRDNADRQELRNFTEFRLGNEDDIEIELCDGQVIHAPVHPIDFYSFLVLGLWKSQVKSFPRKDG